MNHKKGDSEILYVKAFFVMAAFAKAITIFSLIKFVFFCHGNKNLIILSNKIIQLIRFKEENIYK